MNSRCLQCSFYDNGECRYNPPQVRIPDPDSVENYPGQFWPIVKVAKLKVRIAELEADEAKIAPMIKRLTLENLELRTMLARVKEANSDDGCDCILPGDCEWCNSKQGRIDSILSSAPKGKHNTQQEVKFGCEAEVVNAGLKAMLARVGKWRGKQLKECHCPPWDHSGFGCCFCEAELGALDKAISSAPAPIAVVEGYLPGDIDPDYLWDGGGWLCVQKEYGYSECPVTVIVLPANTDSVTEKTND